MQDPTITLLSFTRRSFENKGELFLWHLQSIVLTLDNTGVHLGFVGVFDLLIYIFLIGIHKTFSQFLRFGIESIFVNFLIRYCVPWWFVAKNVFLALVGCDIPKKIKYDVLLSNLTVLF